MKLSKLMYKMRQTTSVMTAVALVLSLFTFWMGNVAYAGAINTHSVVLSTSKPAATAVTYTFNFKPSSTTKIEYVKMELCTVAGAYGDACTLPTSLAFTDSSSSLSGFGATSTIGVPSLAGYVLSVPITGVGTETTATNHVLTLKNFTNPSAGVFFARIRTYSDEGTTMIDEGAVASATIAAVTVSGTQRETFTFSVAGSTNSTCGVTPTAATATAVAFGDFTGTTSINKGQTISVGTNASRGYDVTINQDMPLDNQSSADTISNVGANTSWSEGVTTGFGLCAASGHADAGFSGPQFEPTTSLAVANYTGPVASTNTNVVFRVAVPANQAAGYYTNELVYVATPKY